MFLEIADHNQMSKTLLLVQLHFRNSCFLADKVQPVAVPSIYRSNSLPETVHDKSKSMGTLAVEILH